MNPANPNPTDTRSFNPWPYGIATFLVVFFLLVVGFGIFAVRQRVDLVRADYYEEELRFTRQYDRLSRTKPLKAQIAVAHNPETHEIVLQLPPEHAAGAVTGSIDLYRPSDARLDRRLALSTSATGRQVLDAKSLQEGLWRLQLSWESGGREYFHSTTVIIPPGPRSGTALTHP